MKKIIPFIVFVLFLLAQGVQAQTKGFPAGWEITGGWDATKIPSVNQTNPNNLLPREQQKIGFGEWNKNKVGSVITSQFSLTSVTNLSVDVAYNEYYISYMKYNISITTNGGTSWTELWKATSTGSTNWKWRTIVLNLSIYSGNAKLKFLYDGPIEGDLVAFDLGKLLATGLFTIDTILHPPTLVSPTNNKMNVGIPTKFLWEAVPSIGRHVTYRLQVMMVNGLLVHDRVSDTTSQVISELDENTKYYWRVVASDSIKTGKWSESWSFTTLLSIPAPPVLSSPKNNATGQKLNVTLWWYKSSEENLYDVQVSTSDDFSSLVFEKTTTWRWVVVSGLSHAKTYYWRVRARNSAGASEWSPTWNFMTVGITSFNDESLPTKYFLANYPNPFNPTTIIHYELPEAGNVKIDVYNTLGQNVSTLVNEYKNIGRYEINFDATGLPSGIYFYTLQTENKFLRQKMLLLK
ncbi:T9SS type A sorting domain-containing protein [Patescibacteria group bacterium]|nr:T9SS type A sorting domain-containing protein [Patescibacteria group bacterium]MBU4057736.1 T9SS type A sorting domain-containing protein [Patescibacteria group bacterium]MBU4115981.1 T9SS type A sorting domain-containing protein [Patescibacteria group bacterium]